MSLKRLPRKREYVYKFKDIAAGVLPTVGVKW